jgi:protein deglycase
MCRTVPAQVLVPIAAGSEPAEAFVPIAVLRRAGADVTVAAAGAGTGLRVHAMYGVTVVADASVADCADASYDLVVLPVRTRRQPETLARPSPSGRSR